MVAPMKDITPPSRAKRALAVLDQPAVPADVGAPNSISKKVRAAIDVMVTGDVKTIKEAAEKVGLARESLSRVRRTSPSTWRQDRSARQRQRHRPRQGIQLHSRPRRDPAGHQPGRLGQYRNEGWLHHRLVGGWRAPHADHFAESDQSIGHRTKATVPSPSP